MLTRCSIGYLLGLHEWAGAQIRVDLVALDLTGGELFGFLMKGCLWSLGLHLHLSWSLI